MQFCLATCTWAATIMDRSSPNWRDDNAIEESANEVDRYETRMGRDGDEDGDIDAVIREAENTRGGALNRGGEEDTEWRDQLDKYSGGPSGPDDSMDHPYMHEHNLYVRKIKIIKQLMKKSIKFMLYILS